MASNFLDLTPKQACEASFTGIGFLAGGVMGGPSGNAPLGMLGGAAMGYICGRLVCQFKVFQDLFEQKLSFLSFEQKLSQAEVRAPVVASLSQDLDLTSDQADGLLTGVVAALSVSFDVIGRSKEFQDARKQPATGAAAHGLTVIQNGLASVA